jgi:hypothetical protein
MANVEEAARLNRQPCAGPEIENLSSKICHLSLGETVRKILPGMLTSLKLHGEAAGAVGRAAKHTLASFLKIV